MKRRSDQAGQALVEFSFSVLLIVVLVFLCGLVLKAEFERLRCAHEVFEQTHQRLVQGRDESGSVSLHSNQVRAKLVRSVFSGVTITVDDQGVHGRMTCGRTLERVDLPWLESAQW